VVHASAWLKRGPGQGSGDTSCGHGAEVGSWSTEVAGGAGAGIRWRREVSAWSSDSGEW
jgi:hypothetical protein